MENYVVDMRNVTKRFPGVVALRDMSIQIRPGEIHGLIGENGAGKSTLIKVLTGVHMPDEGETYVNGEKVHFTNPLDAKQAGIACVYQELNIIKELSITDNIFLGQTIEGPAKLLDYKTMHAKAHELMASLGQNIDTNKPCGNFGMGVQQMVEIGRAVLINARMIIMDEPTSSLGEREVAQLMETVRALKDKGVAILFVSHKLEELFELCDRVTVMRDGQHIITEDIANMDNDKLINAMVGRTLDNLFPKEFAEKGDVALEVRHLNYAGVLKDINFRAYNGQVLGFAGLVGAGRTETFRAVFGAEPPDSGEVLLHGKKVSIKNPTDAVKKRVAFLTEDRKGQGLILSMPISLNLILANMKGYSRKSWLNRKAIRQTCDDRITGLKIKTPSEEEVVGKLSGGNQQKVVIGKWLNADADIYIFDEPTRGIDVGAKIEVYNVMNSLTKAGKCVIMISSELPEILGMSDRVIVMREGEVMAEIERDSKHFNQEDIMKAAWGGKL